MALDLFCGMPVTDLDRAIAWYTAFFGREPSSRPSGSEAVWTLGKHRNVYITVRPKRAGSGMCTIFLPEMDSAVETIRSRGFEPVNREANVNGIRKVTFNDPDGNEVEYRGPVRETTD